MGSWDASTNSPVLGSGGGEAAAGTTTGVQANKLIDSTQNFTSTVTVGDQVVNQVDGQTALVSGIDSNTTLSLDTDIMISGEDYTIDNSPFITQGHYYVVSVGGTTSLNGISSWTIGDWVIAGANNEWTKLDHSQVDGTGTVGNLTKWSGTQIISDSIVSESGTAITVDGSLSTNTNLSSTGDFAVNTNKFTVAAASGDTAFAGDLAINTNKFTVDATTGNVAVAGTGSFAGDVTINTGELYVTADSGINTSAKFESGAGSTINYLQLLPNGASDTNSGYIGYDNSNNLKLFTQNTLAVTLDASQNSTFAGSVGIGGNAASNGYMVDITPTGGNIIRSSRGTSVFGSYQSNNSDVYLGTISNNTFKIITNDTTAITVSNSQNATFAGAVSTGGYLTLNSGDNIPRLIFNGSGDDFFLSNTANYFGLYNNTDSRWDIQVDGAGNSTFAGEISSSDDININNGKLVVNHTSAEVRIKSTSDTGESYINFSDSSDINPGQIYYGHSNNNMVFRTNDSEKMRITDAGDITVSGGDLFLNSGTNYTDKGVVYFSNERSAIISDIVSGTANGDTSLDFQTRVNGSRASAIFIDEFRSVNIPAYADGIKLKITSSAGANNNIIEIGQLGSDGFLDVSSAGGGIISHLSGYSGYESYFLSDVGIGVANASDYWANANNLVVGNLGTVSGITIATDGNLVGSLVFADGTGAGDNTRGAVQYNHSVDSMYFRVNNDTKMYINSAGQLSLGTPNVYSPTGGGVTEVTIKHDSNDRVNTVITNQNSGGSAGAALVLATYGQDWIIESESLAAGGALTFSRGSSQYFEINGAGQGYFSGGVRVGGLYITALQGNSQLTNASSSSGSNPSYIGQGLISVTISDAKAKENFEDVKENECLNQVQSLAKYVKKFDWIDEDWKKEKGRTIGMVAQEVNEEFPELVHSPKNYEDEGWAIRYQEIVPTLIKSIQELKAEVDLLKQECKCKN